MGLYLVSHRQNFAFRFFNFEANIELAMHMLTATAKSSSGVPAKPLEPTRRGHYILVKRKATLRHLRHLRDRPQGQRNFRTIATPEIIPEIVYCEFSLAYVYADPADRVNSLPTLYFLNSRVGLLLFDCELYIVSSNGNFFL